MLTYTLLEIAKACGGAFVGDEALLQMPVSDIVIDSRKVSAGALYVPVIGERFDGHAFIEQARANGAVCVITQHALESAPYILVADVLEALQDIAHAYRCKFDIPVIGITGSVGKTSTKEMLSAVLGTKLTVVKTVGSENNQTGVPLTLFRFDEAHEAAIVEMGTNHFGEIERLSRMAEPTICLFTNIGVAHIEFFGSREGILQGKTEMLTHMRKGGSIIVNGDDDQLAAVDGAMRYGLGEGLDVRATDIEDLGLLGMRFTAQYCGESIRLSVPSPGIHSVMNALAAIAVGLVLGMRLPELAAGVEAYVPPKGRMCIVKTDSFTILDDTYNANPNSVMASIDVLERVQGRRVCILGDMLELGAQSDEFHEVIGMYAAMHGIDVILCVGPNSEQTFLGAIGLAPRRARYFETQESLLEILPLLLERNDTVLVKGSHGMHLEQTVEMLKRFVP